MGSLPAPWVKLLPVRAGGAEQHLVFHAGWAIGSQTFPSSQKNLLPPRVAKCPAWHEAKPRPFLWPWLQILEVQAWKSNSRVVSGCDVSVACRSLMLLPPEVVRSPCLQSCKGWGGPTLCWDLDRDFEQLQELVVPAGGQSCPAWERGSLAPSVYLQGTSRVPGRGQRSKDGVAADRGHLLGTSLLRSRQPLQRTPGHKN